MEQIIIEVKDKTKAQALVDFLRALEFVENISITDLRTAMPSKEKEEKFFALAGIWEGRDISQESIRKEAWPERK